MKTNEIVRSLRKNKMLSSVIPPWAHATIPYPFVRNGVSCLGFYFYQMKEVSGKHQITAPIIQVQVTYPGAKIVSITTSPLFLSAGMDPKAELGFYPGSGLQGKTLQESDAAYAAYYEACDEYLLSGKKEDWLSNLAVVKEDGMEPYYSLFAAETCAAPSKITMPTVTKSVDHTVRSKASAPGFSPATVRIARKVKDFLSDSMFDRQSKEFEALSQGFLREDCRVAVIGEFSRGKSTFLNRLMGRELLPVGDLPTTAVLTQIRKGRDGMSFIGKDKSIVQGQLSVEALENYLADDAGRDPEGVLDLRVDLPWLSSDRIVFYDTPGAGDLIGKRADIVLRAINTCDFTVMVISARAACSMTEMQFLRDNVMLKKIPQIAVAITKLDTIPEKERGKVVDFIRKKIAAVAPSARFFLMDDLAGVDRSQFDAIGEDAIRESIVSAFASDKEVAVSRERQYLQRISLILGEAGKEIEVVSAAEAMPAQEQKDAIRRLEEAKANIDILRQDLATACASAKLDAQKQVRGVIADDEENFVKKMTRSLRHSNDIKQWLEQDFPDIAEEGFKQTSLKLDLWMGKRIAADKASFAATASKRLSIRNLSVSMPSFSVPPGDFGIDTNAEMKDLDKWRTGARMATIGTMVLLAGLGPAAMIASGVGGILTDKFLKASIEKQRADAIAAISAKLQSVFSDLKDRAAEYLENSYGEMAKVLDNEAQYAIDNAIAKIKAAEGQTDKMTEPSQVKANALKVLIAEIRNCYI